MTSTDAGTIEIRIVTGGPDLDEVRGLLGEYNAHLFTTIDPALLRHRETELDGLPGDFAPPLGALLLATAAGRPVGCVGLRLVATAQDRFAGECCRMWVSSEARGRSLGRQLVTSVIALARRIGYTALYLNTVPETMAAAHRLYMQFGFLPVAPYKEVTIPGIRFFRLALEESDPEPRSA